MSDVYGNAERYAQKKQTINSWKAPRENIEAVKRYLSEQIDALSPGFRYSTLIVLKRIFHGKEQGAKQGKLARPPLIKKPLSEMTLDDFREVDKALKKEGFMKETYHKHANALRNLYEQEFEESEEPEHLKILTAFGRTGRRAFFQYPRDSQSNKSLDKKNFYTFDEFKEILRTTSRPQDKALLVVAWETTSRPNEYLTLKVGDVEKMKHGFKIKAHISKKKGETETRNLYVVTFRAEFAEFYNKHPFRDEPDAPLFYREDNQTDYGKPLGIAGANKKLKTLDFRSGVKKNGTLYFLRHGGYTWKKSLGMKDALAGKDMGWVPGSKQARRYEHLQDSDVLQERLRLADERFEEEVKPKLKVRVCPFCNQENSPLNEMCATCGQTLDLKMVTKELEALKQAQAEMVERITKDILEKMKDERKETS